MQNNVSNKIVNLREKYIFLIHTNSFVQRGFFFSKLSMENLNFT